MHHPLQMKLILILITIVSTGFSFSYAGSTGSATTHLTINGAQLWANNCSRCHNFRSPTEYTPNQWTTIMAHMRIQGGLTGQESRAILEYLTQASESQFATASTQSPTSQTTNTNQSVTTKGKTATSALSGSAIYQKTCIACHGVNGKGIAPSIPDFTKKGGILSQPSKVLFNNIKQGIGGMPPKGGNPALTDQDLKAALSYIENTFAR